MGFLLMVLVAPVIWGYERLINYKVNLKKLNN